MFLMTFFLLQQNVQCKNQVWSLDSKLQASNFFVRFPVIFPASTRGSAPVWRVAGEGLAKKASVIQLQGKSQNCNTLSCRCPTPEFCLSAFILCFTGHCMYYYLKHCWTQAPNDTGGWVKLSGLHFLIFQPVCFENRKSNILIQIVVHIFLAKKYH